MIMKEVKKNLSMAKINCYIPNDRCNVNIGFNSQSSKQGDHFVTTDY